MDIYQLKFLKYKMKYEKLINKIGGMQQVANVSQTQTQLQFDDPDLDDQDYPISYKIWLDRILRYFRYGDDGGGDDSIRDKVSIKLGVPKNKGILEKSIEYKKAINNIPTLEEKYKLSTIDDKTKFMDEYKKFIDYLKGNLWNNIFYRSNPGEKIGSNRIYKFYIEKNEFNWSKKTLESELVKLDDIIIPLFEEKIKEKKDFDKKMEELNLDDSDKTRIKVWEQHRKDEDTYNVDIFDNIDKALVGIKIYRRKIISELSVYHFDKNDLDKEKLIAKAKKLKEIISNQKTLLRLKIAKIIISIDMSEREKIKIIESGKNLFFILFFYKTNQTTKTN